MRQLEVQQQREPRRRPVFCQGHKNGFVILAVHAWSHFARFLSTNDLRPRFEQYLRSSLRLPPSWLALPPSWLDGGGWEVGTEAIFTCRRKRYRGVGKTSVILSCLTIDCTNELMDVRAGKKMFPTM